MPTNRGETDREPATVWLTPCVRALASLLAALLIGAVVSGCQPSETSSSAASADPVDFTVRDLRGNPIKLSDWRGHPVIVDFWATWCLPCRREIPELNEIYRRYQNKGLKVLGVSLDAVKGDGLSAVTPFVREFKVTYPIAMADDALAERLELEAVPTTLFLSRDGHVLARIEGAGRPGELSAAVERLLKR